MKRIALLSAAMLMATGSAFADDEKIMTIGDVAPPIDIAHWVKGVKPFTEFEKEKIYVIEFWATWCGPCVASMPHLSEVQEKYKDYDVTVVSVSDEPLSKVVSFLFKEYRGDNKIHNDRTQYTLTTDPDGSVKKAYFTAAGQRGIPCAFIIGKDTKVEWIGHPMMMDDPLEAVVKDNWDREAFKNKFESEQRVQREMAKQNRALRDAMQSGDHDQVLAILDKMIESTGGSPSIYVRKFNLLVGTMNDPDRGYAVGRQIMKDNWDNPMILNQISWFTVDDRSVQTRDLGFAMEAAMRASELTGNKDGAILDTVARCFYEKGDLKGAVEWQKKAVEHAQGGMADELKKTLEKYMGELKDS